MDEQDLIQGAQRGSLSAFNQLVLSYQALAYNLAYRLLGERDLAADATQDSFLKAYQGLSRFRGGAFRSWLLHIVTNTCYDRLRWQRRHPAGPLEVEGNDSDYDPDYDTRLVDPTESPEEHAARGELAQSIQAALLRLPVDQRTVVVLRDIEGLDYEEIASITGLALGTVKSRLSRARARLRDLLRSTGCQPDVTPPSSRACTRAVC